MASLLEPEVIPYISYHYERIFGFEFFSGECVNHPDNLGINYLAFPIKGWTSDHPLNRMTGPKKTFYDIEIPIPFVGRMSTYDAKEIHKSRKVAWKTRKVDYNLARELVDPIVEMRGTRRVRPDIWSKSIPMWAEQSQSVWTHRTTRKWVHGLSDAEINSALGDTKYAADPYRAYASGGYNIVTGGYEERPAYDQHLQVAELMKVCTPVRDSLVFKSVPPVIPDKDDWYVGITGENPPVVVVVEAFTSDALQTFSSSHVAEETVVEMSNVDAEENLPFDEICLGEDQEEGHSLSPELEFPDLLDVDWEGVF